MVISDHSQIGVQLKKNRWGIKKKYKNHSLKRKAPLPRFVLKEIKILSGRLTCNEIKGQAPTQQDPTQQSF